MYPPADPPALSNLEARVDRGLPDDYLEFLLTTMRGGELLRATAGPPGSFSLPRSLPVAQLGIAAE